MFFPERLSSVKPDDYVLEIGPGGAPHSRSDVFLERSFDDEKIAEAQRGYAPELNSNKKVVYYDGGAFPFKDKEFDYVICSHVLEHVLDIASFLKEMFRVAQKGYIEYPLIYYDYIYDFPEHLTFLKLQQRALYYLPKSMTLLSEFSEVSSFFRKSLDAGYFSLVDDLKQELFEGFEWDAPFEIKKAEKIADVCWDNVEMNPDSNIRPSLILRAKTALRRILT